MNSEQPAARIATHCAVCARELTDAVSLNRGVGPECSKLYYQAPPTDGVDYATLARGLEGLGGYAEWAHDCAVAGDALLEGDTAKAAEIAGRFNSRAVANALAMQIAIEQKGERVQQLTLALAALGYGTLAWRIALRLFGRKAERVVIRAARPTVVRPTLPPPAVRVERRADAFGRVTLVVRSPFSESFVARRRALGGHWVATEQANHYPESLRAAVWRDIQDCYPDHVLIVDGVATGRTPPARGFAEAAE